MGVSPRKIRVIGLSLAGCVLLGGTTRAQAPKADRQVQGAAANTGTASSASLKPGKPTIVGTIDLDYVFKNYEKVKAATKEIQSAIGVRKAELMRLEEQARSVYEMMKKLNPTSEDYHKQENVLTELKAKAEATKESAEREISNRQAEMMATLYKEVQAYSAWVAQHRGITHVLTSSSSPPSGSDPNSVMAAVNRPVIYSDPGNDITKEVVFYLNQSYQKLGKPTDRPAPAQGHQGQAPGNATVGSQ